MKTIDFPVVFYRPDFSFKEHIDNLDSGPKVKSIIQRENKSLDDRDVCIHVDTNPHNKHVLLLEMVLYFLFFYLYSLYFSKLFALKRTTATIH